MGPGGMTNRSRNLTNNVMEFSAIKSIISILMQFPALDILGYSLRMQPGNQGRDTEV